MKYLFRLERSRLYFHCHQHPEWPAHSPRGGGVGYFGLSPARPADGPGHKRTYTLKDTGFRLFSFTFKVIIPKTGTLHKHHLFPIYLPKYWSVLFLFCIIVIFSCYNDCFHRLVTGRDSFERQKKSSEGAGRAGKGSTPFPLPGVRPGGMAGVIPVLPLVPFRGTCLLVRDFVSSDFPP